MARFTLWQDFFRFIRSVRIYFIRVFWFIGICKLFIRIQSILLRFRIQNVWKRDHNRTFFSQFRESAYKRHKRRKKILQQNGRVFHKSEKMFASLNLALKSRYFLRQTLQDKHSNEPWNWFVKSSIPGTLLPVFENFHHRFSRPDWPPLSLQVD